MRYSMTSSDLRWIIKTTSDSTFNVVFLFQEKILLRMSNHKQENFQAFPSGIPVHPPAYGIPYAGQQYDQPQVGQPSVQAHHLPAAPVVVQQVPNTISLTYGRNPVRTICPHCGKTVSNTTVVLYYVMKITFPMKPFKVMTEVSYKSGAVTWLSCGGCAILGCCLGCCLIPFCIDDLKDAVHTCPNCKKIITTKTVMG